MLSAILSQSKIGVTGFLLWLFIFGAGCAGPALTSRIVQEEPSWFVRLDSYGTGGESPRYDHPSTWTTEELTAILSRLLLEDRVGLMDSAQPPRPVFSWDEIVFLVPAVKESFQRASPQEWVAFYIGSPRGDELAITSGGIFLSDAQLHLVVSNHRTLLGKESADVEAVRENPFHSVRGSGGTLAFESSRYILRRQANWSGGHRASASELVLDHRGFLTILQSTGTIATLSSPRESGSLTPSSGPRSTESLKQNPDPLTVILQLREENERLKRTVAEQEAEITRLKRPR